MICVDEKCKQLLRETRCPLSAKLGTLAKEDYEYERAGTCNIFVAVEPRGERRIAQVTARRTQGRFRRLRLPDAAPRVGVVFPRTQGSLGPGQPQHPLPQIAN